MIAFLIFNITARTFTHCFTISSASGASENLREFLFGELGELCVQGFNFLFEGIEFFCGFYFRILL